MSYLSALASNGLSVGLRLYGTRPSGVARSEELAIPEESTCPQAEPTKPTEKTSRAEPVPLSPEEQALGRAEAVAQLASAGSLGVLQETRAARSEKKSSGSEDQLSEEEKVRGSKELTEEEKKVVEKLKTRDREVRAHEAAHVAASGGLAGSPTFVFQTGPDGKRYAIGGEVSVQSPGSDDPAQALKDAEAIKKAAEAPASPSSQDRAVAAAAAADIAKLKALEQEEKESDQDEPSQTSLLASDDYSSPTEPQGSGVFNGETISQKAHRVYEAVKNSLNATTRPVLARI
ncbi:MAG: hypothetical protein LBR11_10315 [Deltaproteobacteria bacterium]|nr:hypothetical protein [Deltaproteobacteria bacterium]